MQTRLIPFSQQQPGTWRGGEVHEIFRDPPDADYPAGDYDLWVGTATIERAAVYSYFARAERLHIPLTGQGLRLDFDDPVESVFLTTQKACTFSGTRPLHATPVDGPVLAFNLIYRQGQTSGFRFIPAAELPFSHAVDVAAGERLSLIVYGTSGGASEGVDGGLNGEALVHSQGVTYTLRPGDTFLLQGVGPATASFQVESPGGKAQLLMAFVRDKREQPPQPTTSS